MKNFTIQKNMVFIVLNTQSSVDSTCTESIDNQSHFEVDLSRIVVNKIRLIIAILTPKYYTK